MLTKNQQLANRSVVEEIRELGRYDDFKKICNEWFFMAPGQDGVEFFALAGSCGPIAAKSLRQAVYSSPLYQETSIDKFAVAFLIGATS